MSDLYLYLMCSRNKDNKGVDGFRRRSVSILERKYNEYKIKEKFEQFCSDGVPGEVSRLYRSVNSRNEDAMRKDVAIRIIRDSPDMTKLNSVLDSVALQPQCRDEKKWMFDFDLKDEEILNQFVKDIPVDTETYETPNGYAIVCMHGFDTRPLLEKYDKYNISLNKDAMLFLEAKKDHR